VPGLVQMMLKRV